MQNCRTCGSTMLVEKSFRAALPLVGFGLLLSLASLLGFGFGFYRLLGFGDTREEIMAEARIDARTTLEQVAVPTVVVMKVLERAWISDNERKQLSDAQWKRVERARYDLALAQESSISANSTTMPMFLIGGSMLGGLSGGALVSREERYRCVPCESRART